MFPFGAGDRVGGHTDETDPLGRAPGAGLPEKAGLFRAAHEALELPDRGDGEANLTDGRLRVRSQALEREEAWAPRYVGDELAATHQQAHRARTDATLWAARAEVTDDPTELAALRADAARARTEAETLTGRAAELETADAARGAWFAATAATRDVAERARAELKARGVDLDDPGERVTADEWLAAHRGEQLVDNADREVRDEHELADTNHAELARVAAEDTAETDVSDVRDTTTRAATESTDPAERRRVPTADETAEAVARAQVALAEIAARAEADAAREARDAEDHARREELTRWAEQDRAAERAALDREDELVRER